MVSSTNLGVSNTGYTSAVTTPQNQPKTTDERKNSPVYKIAIASFAGLSGILAGAGIGVATYVLLPALPIVVPILIGVGVGIVYGTGKGAVVHKLAQKIKEWITPKLVPIALNTSNEPIKSTGENLKTKVDKLEQSAPEVMQDKKEIQDIEKLLRSLEEWTVKSEVNQTEERLKAELDELDSGTLEAIQDRKEVQDPEELFQLLEEWTVEPKANQTELLTAKSKQALTPDQNQMHLLKEKLLKEVEEMKINLNKMVYIKNEQISGTQFDKDKHSLKSLLDINPFGFNLENEEEINEKELKTFERIVNIAKKSYDRFLKSYNYDVITSINTK